MGQLCRNGTRRPRARSPASPQVTAIPLSFTLYLGPVAAAGARTTPAEERRAREAVTSLAEQRQGLLLDPALPLLLLVEEHLGRFPEVLAHMDKIQDEFEAGKTRLDATLQGRIPIA